MRAHHLTGSRAKCYRELREVNHAKNYFMAGIIRSFIYLSMPIFNVLV